MECQVCSADNPDSNRFCESCGVGLALKCAACGYQCGLSARFCGGCGAPLSSAAVAGGMRPPHAASEPSSGWGELKQATVLFADIVSSTEQIAELDPEQAMDRLQPAVMAMCAAVERFGGTVMRTLGDGVMALFGVPKALEGHARLACEAALHMQDAFEGNTQGLSIRVGLHSGLVASDPHAPDGGKGGGAHGMTIHLASRVVGLAPPAGVTLTGDCHALAQAAVNVRSLGPKPLKGVPAPVEIFQLLSLKPAFESVSFHRPGLTPFRGRDRELSALQQAQGLSASSQAKIVGVCGAPGTGKSRLCYEFAQWCRARDIPVYEVRAQLYGNATPLQPVLEVMRKFLFHVSAGDDPQKVRDRVAQCMAQAGLADQGDVALVWDFLSVAAAGPDVAPKARRIRLLAILRALVRQAATNTAVLILEDLHWLDEASEEFMGALIEAAVDTRTMLLLNYRPSYRSPWARMPAFQQIELTELSAADTDAMVRELISQSRDLQEISRLVVRRSGGNPFFAEELVRSLAESGALADAQSGRGLESIERALPATVQAVIGARIDRLNETEKTVLQICAIVGKEIPLAILRQVAGPMLGDLDRVLEALCQAELLEAQPPNALGRRMAFRHPLLQEVAYSAQLKAKRGSIHAAVAQAMEAFYSDHLDEFAGLIAHHYEAAGRSIEAARYAAQAARWIGATNSAQAIKHWRKVLSLLQGQPHSAELDHLRVRAGGQIGILGWREGLTLNEVLPVIQQASSLATSLDRRLIQLLFIVEGRMRWSNGGPADEYVAMVDKAAALEQGDAGRLAALNVFKSQAFGWAGQLREALAANELALAGVHDINVADSDFIGIHIEHWLQLMRIRLLTRMGRMRDVEESSSVLSAIERESVDPIILLIHHQSRVEFAYWTGDVAMASRYAKAAVKLADNNASPYFLAFAMGTSAACKMVEGDFSGAVRDNFDALAVVRRSNVALEYESEILANLADAHLNLGDQSGARALADEAVLLARQRSNRYAECRALVTQAAVQAPRQAFADDASAARFAAAEALIAATGAEVLNAGLALAKSRLLTAVKA